MAAMTVMSDILYPVMVHLRNPRFLGRYVYPEISPYEDNSVNVGVTGYRNVLYWTFWTWV